MKKLIFFILFITHGICCVAQQTSGSTLSRQNFLDAIKPSNTVSLQNAINEAKLADLNPEVRRIFLDIWHNGRASVDLKGNDASSLEIRTAAAGAIYQWSVRNEGADANVLKDAHKFLQQSMLNSDKSVSIEAISSLIVSRNNKDVATFFDIAKKQDERFKAAVIALNARCDKASAEMAEKLEDGLSAGNRQFLEASSARRRAHCPQQSS